MKHPLRLTIAAKSDPEMIVGQAVSVNPSRMQFFFRVKDGGRHDGMSKIILNTPKEVLYVEEDHDQILERYDDPD